MCCVCVFSFCQESRDMILGDKSHTPEVVLSHMWNRWNDFGVDHVDWCDP
jgi:hypothetical protein